MPQQTTTFIHKKGAWIDPKQPKVYLVQGMRGSGKSLLDEMVAEQLYLKHWTILDLLGARTLENFYWAVNKNHRTDYLKEIKIEPSKKGMIHCNCNTRYPITILCPDYISFDQDSLDRYNDLYYTREEFLVERRNPKSKIFGEMEFNSKARKTQKELVKVRYLQPPTMTGSNKDIIVEQFYEAVLEARKEHRIICVNPKLFPNEFHRYKTLEIIIRSLEALMYAHFKPPTEKSVGKTKDRWTNRDKNHNKLAVVMREFGEVTANILKGENQSTLTKKALLQYIRQTRHYGITLIGDYQRPDDVFPAIRQQSDIFIIKRAPQQLLGDGWEWLFKDINIQRKKIFDRWGDNAMSRMWANKDFPRIEQLADNYCYIVYIDNSYKLSKIPSPNFHHKRQDEHFENDTGILWKELPHAKIGKSVAKSEGRVAMEYEQNDVDEKLYKIITDTIGDRARPNWDEVLVKVTQLVSAGIITVPTSWNNKDNIRKWYSRRKARMEKGG